MIFEKNIAKLKQADSILADAVIGSAGAVHMKVVETKNGMLSLRVNNVSLHSLYDPAAEAKAWVKYYKEEIENAASIYVFGFGLGYHLLELCKITGSQVTVIEPAEDVLRKALETVDLTSILSRIRIITDSRIPPVENKITVLRHKPSVDLNPEYFGNILRKIRSRELVDRGLKIMVVSPVFGGSHPITKFCSSSLKKLGHTVELIDNGRFADMLFFSKDISKNQAIYSRLLKKLSAFLSELVLARCETFKPDIVLGLAQAPLTAECLEILRRNKITTAFWFVEDFRVMDYWSTRVKHYDYFFTIQKGDFFDELKKAGASNYYYLPVAAAPDIHKPVELSDEDIEYFGSDVSFMGAGYYNRRHFFNGLIDFGLKIWGSDWDMTSALAKCVQKSGERVSTDETVKIFNAAKININLHSSTYHKGSNPFGDFVNPRTFEIFSCGGFQLVDRRSALSELFKEGEEIIVFENLEDVRDKITYYLNNPGERKAIAEKGRQRVLKEHTYENRMSDMLDIIAENGLERPPWLEDTEDVDALIKEAGEGSELGKYLSRFSGRKRISLAEITKEISEGEGDISKTEAIFMMMNEFVQ